MQKIIDPRHHAGHVTSIILKPNFITHPYFKYEVIFQNKIRLTTRVNNRENITI